MMGLDFGLSDFRLSTSFGNGQYLVGGNVIENVCLTTGPADFESFDFAVAA